MISLISVDISSNLSDHWWAIWNIFLFIIILCQQIQSIFQRKNQIPFVSWLVHFWCISQSNTIPRGTKINHHNPMLLTASAIGIWIETFNIGITAIIIIWISILYTSSCFLFVQVLGLGAGGGEDHQACCPLWNWKPQNDQWSFYWSVTFYWSVIFLWSIILILPNHINPSPLNTESPKWPLTQSKT